MARGRYPKRIKTPPPDPAIADRYLFEWTSADLYKRPDAFPQLDSESLFGNRLPLELEVGCGTGEFLCWMAFARPKSNFVGIDISPRPLYRGVALASKLSLENVKFIKADIRLVYPLMGAASLEAVYLHFPTPYTKRKYRRRRIVNPSFLDCVHHAIVPKGRLSIMTDNRELFAEMRGHVSRDPRFAEVAEDDYRLRLDGSLKSPNQLVWESRGQKTLRLEIEKRIHRDPPIPESGSVPYDVSQSQVARGGYPG